jgi:hypothetical protein
VRAAGDLAGEAAEVAAAVAAAGAGAPYLNLNLEGVDRDPDSALLFEVYLNLPAETPPGPGSLYYVGHFAFFGHTAHGHPPPEEEAEAEGERVPEAHQHPGNTFTFNITSLVNQQRARRIWSDNGFAVTLVPGGRGPEAVPSAAAAEAERPEMGEVRISRATITAE